MKVVLFANTDWYLFNFRRSLAVALQQSGYDVLLVSPPGLYGEKLCALGLRWQALPMSRRSLNPLREAALMLHLWCLCRRENPALVHGFTIKCAVYGSLAARAAGVPARVGAVAGMGYVFIGNTWQARLLRPVVRGLLRFALNGKRARLILQNPDDVELFRMARIVDMNRVTLIAGSGVDCVRFSPAASSLPPDARLTLVVASRLLWDKGLGELMTALRAQKSAGRDIRVLLAGLPDAGNPASIDEPTVQAWVDEGLVEWLRHVDDMPKLFAQCHVAVLPSYREGLPKSLIEAAACGLALIATDVPGCREVVINGVTGILVKVRDAEALGAAIARLDDNRSMVQKMGAAARDHVRASFDDGIVISQTLEVYRDLLGFEHV